jgi:hypothetical protein
VEPNYQIVAAERFRDGIVLRIALIGLLVAFCLVWTVVAGRDIHFDLLNYHYYAAHAFWNDRLGKDLLPASVQSYLNPIAYLPFYWMVQAGWHSLIIGLVLATIHSINLILLMLLAETALFPDVKHRQLFGFAAAMAGGLSPIFLAEVGSTFNDVTTSIGVLLGLYLLFRRTSLLPNMLMAGVAMGIAAGLKLTNAIFLISVVPSLLILFDNWNTRARAVLWFSAGAALGLAVSEGYWGYRVYQEFGNPFFPFMNKLFESPDFPSANIVHDRFLPRSILDVITLPLRMASLQPWEYTEPVAPDLRFMATIVVAGIGLLSAVFRSRTGRTSLVIDRPNAARNALFTFFATSLLLWLASSGNGRYGLPLLLLIGPLLVSVVYTFFSIQAATLTTATIMVLQVAHMAIGGNPRWGSVAWKPDWFNNFSVPPSISQQPYLHLSMGLQSLSFIVPYLHPDSAFINVVGQWPIPSKGYGADRLWGLLKKYDSRTRILTALPKDEYVDGKPTRKAITVINQSLDRLNLQLRPESCQGFKMQLFENADSTPKALQNNDVIAKKYESVQMLSCIVAVKKIRDSELVRAEQHLAPIYDAFEAACPELFSPPGAALEKVDKYWKKFYSNSDLTLWTDGTLLFYSRIRGTVNVDVGKVSDFKNNRRKIDCKAMPRPPIRF